MSCFKKTNDGNKEMIITIAKQFYQSTFASKSKNFKMSLWVCTFRRLSQTHINLLINTRQERFFLGFNSNEFPLFTITVRRKKPQGTSSLIHFLNKPSIVKQLFIETSA